jgi:hypothetical protein
MKGIWSSKFSNFLDLIQEFVSNSFEIAFGLFMIGLINEFDS